MSATLATVFNFVTWYSSGHAMLSRQCRTWGFKKLLKTAQFEGYFCAWSGSAIIAAITVGDIYPDNSWGDGRHATQVQAVRIALVSAFRLIK
jgi:hypothetical protein